MAHATRCAAGSGIRNEARGDAMTPFMLRVAEAFDERVDEEEWPSPHLRPARAWDIGTGTDRQVAIRSYAEQLVCEANAVISTEADHLSLDDEVGHEELAFNIRYRGRAARVSLMYADHLAYGQIVGDGIARSEPSELSGPEALPDLLMLLILESQAAA
ncbi:hypothetical protein [Mobilicoccus sp.]|uniref:hypothetical protein n=1 Tax=Mobilicoccus sp. TaxID=2034349 RepID=UPI0028AA871E|nr:hypothetical protein [Mobilicoccus sp.]